MGKRSRRVAHATLFHTIHFSRARHSGPPKTLACCAIVRSPIDRGFAGAASAGKNARARPLSNLDAYASRHRWNRTRFPPSTPPSTPSISRGRRGRADRCALAATLTGIARPSPFGRSRLGSARIVQRNAGDRRTARCAAARASPRPSIRRLDRARRLCLGETLEKASGAFAALARPRMPLYRRVAGSRPPSRNPSNSVSAGPLDSTQVPGAIFR